MAKYRKRPVVIEATQWDGDPLSGLGVGFEVDGNQLVIRTLEGDMRADPGDWIIRGVQGEFYPCKDAIFRATYEAIEE